MKKKPNLKARIANLKAIVDRIGEPRKTYGLWTVPKMTKFEKQQLIVARAELRRLESV